MVFLNINTDVFIIYKCLLRTGGIWPLDGLKRGSVIIYLVLELFQVGIVLWRLVDPLGECAGHELRRIDVTLIAWLVIAATLRLAIRLYGNRMIPLIESTIDDWSSITETTNRRIMISHDKFGTLHFLFLFMGFVMFPIACDVTSLAFPNASRMTNRRLLNCADVDSLRWGIAMPILTFVMLLFGRLAHCSSVLLFWSLAMHLCGQYQILKEQFKEFLIIIKNRKERHREFCRLVDRHNQLIDLSVKLEDSFTVFVALELFAGQLLICVFASRLGYAINGSNWTEITTSFIYIVFLSGLLFIYYYASDYLTACCEEIGEVFMQCNWYDLSKDSITNFSIVIARSRMPTSLTAVKLYKLNLYNFKNVIQAVYSYISLIVAITKN